MLDGMEAVGISGVVRSDRYHSTRLLRSGANTIPFMIRYSVM